MVAVEINASQLRKAQKALGHIKNGVPKALVPAINRGLDAGKTVVKREIRKEYLIKAKDIPIHKKGATRSRLGGALVVASGMLHLDKFLVSGGIKGRPLFARVKVGGGGEIAHAFRWNLMSFERVGTPRLPIRRLLTIGAGIMASQPAVGPAANKAMGDTVDKRIDHEIKRVLASAGGHS